MWSTISLVFLCYFRCCYLLDHCFINKESSIIVDQYLSIEWIFISIALSVMVSMIDGLKCSLLRCLTCDHREFNFFENFEIILKKNFLKWIFDFLNCWILNSKVQQENHKIQEIQDCQSVLDFRYLKVSLVILKYYFLSDWIWETYCFVSRDHIKIDEVWLLIHDGKTTSIHHKLIIFCVFFFLIARKPQMVMK